MAINVSTLHYRLIAQETLFAMYGRFKPNLVSYRQSIMIKETLNTAIYMFHLRMAIAVSRSVLTAMQTVDDKIHAIHLLDAMHHTSTLQTKRPLYN